MRAAIDQADIPVPLLFPEKHHRSVEQGASKEPVVCDFLFPSSHIPKVSNVLSHNALPVNLMNQVVLLWKETMQHKRFFSRDPQLVTERILAAAESEFSTEGFTGASTNRIARQFGGSKATLFRYYPTKAELFVAVMRRISERRVAGIDWEALDSDDPIAGLTAFARSALEGSVSGDALFVGRMVVAHGHEFPALRSAFTAMAIKPIVDGLADFLRECTRKGVLNCTDCEADAIRFFDLAVGGWTTRALFGGLPDQGKAFLDTEAAASASLFLEGRRAAFTASDKKLALNG